MIAIIDYDAGNIKSVEKALQFLGEEVIVTSDRDAILSADKAILPGVGSFGDAMEKIRERNLEEVIHEFVESGKPFLGICLGLQLFFESSEETPGVKGLGLLKGKITRIPNEYKQNGETVTQNVPQIGWNNIKVNPSSKLLKGLGDNPYVYFVHSYYLQADDIEDVAATTEYGVTIHAAVERMNVMATQFHPEKSSDVGMNILRNFIAM
ncbi:MAG: imidazole glycerol phosphate synthase subunit HisH [Eubacterium sp.]|nr:imidazole glycerol phosphate synthase subunit HisH [Eubacterium sp.]MEE3398538.1 imidazole glycerol phosphate synthase subunit HisH [Eubacterium sp.]